MRDLVPKLVEQHCLQPPEVLTKVVPNKMLGQIVVKIKN